jgi:hypothetical protein
MRQGDLPPAQRLLRPLVTTIIAGLALHGMLTLAKDALGILPGFRRYEDFQRPLGRWAGAQAGSLAPCLTGAPAQPQRLRPEDDRRRRYQHECPAC